MAFPIVVAALAPQIAAAVSTVSTTVAAGISAGTAVVGGIIGGGIVHLRNKDAQEKTGSRLKRLEERLSSIEGNQSAENEKGKSVKKENAAKSSRQRNKEVIDYLIKENKALRQQVMLNQQRVNQSALQQTAQQSSSQPSSAYSQDQNAYAFFAGEGPSHPLHSDLNNLNNIPMPATLSSNNHNLNGLQMPSVESFNTNSIDQLPEPAFSRRTMPGTQDVIQKTVDEVNENLDEDTEDNHSISSHESFVYSDLGTSFFSNDNDSQHSLVTLNKNKFV